MNEIRTVRAPVVAGMFYPADPDELNEQIRDLLQRAGKRQKVKGRVRGIVSPHAGYMYSGLTAAYAYSALQGETFETVVVVSPSHVDFFKGASIYSGDVYRTPLGDVDINTTMRDRLVSASDSIEASMHGHTTEHALEVQLPFLQKVLPPFKLVPVVMGEQSAGLCFDLGNALASVLVNENVLLVASTDLSHFHSSDIAERLDRVIMSDINHFDCEQLMKDLETRHTEACGGGPTVAVLTALKNLGVDKIEVVHYSNSGDTTGDYASVVGYMSAVAYS